MNSKPCPHRNEVERISWRRIKRISNAMRADGRTVPFGRREISTVKRFLHDMIDVHGSNWMVETNAYVAAMERQQERRVS